MDSFRTWGAFSPRDYTFSPWDIHLCRSILGSSSRILRLLSPFVRPRGDCGASPSQRLSRLTSIRLASSADLEKKEGRRPFSAASWASYHLQQTRLQLAPCPSFHPATTLTAAHCYTSLPARPDVESTLVQRGHFDESLHQTTRPTDPGFLLSLTVTATPAPPTCTGSAPARRAQSPPKPRSGSRTDQTQNTRVNPPCALLLSQLELKSPILRATPFSEGPLFLPHFLVVFTTLFPHHHEPSTFLPHLDSFLLFSETICKHALPSRTGISCKSLQSWEPQAGGVQQARAHRRTRGESDTTPTPATGISVHCAPGTPDPEPDLCSHQRPATGAGTHPHTSPRRHASLAASGHPSIRCGVPSTGSSTPPIRDNRLVTAATPCSGYPQILSPRGRPKKEGPCYPAEYHAERAIE